MQDREKQGLLPLVYHPVIWWLDQIKYNSLPVTSDLFHALPEPCSFVPITINIFAVPLASSPEEIKAVAANAREFIRSTCKKVERRLGATTIGLFGHTETSAPKRGDELEPYLASGIDPDEFCTVVHFHGWLIALAPVDVAREEFVRAISGSSNEPRRIHFGERHHKTETLDASVCNWIGYGIKNEHSVSVEPEFSDPNVRYVIGRFQKYLRGDGLRGTRIRFGMTAVLRSLNEYWNRNRCAIYAAIVRLEQASARLSAPEGLLEDYLSWKQPEDRLVSIDPREIPFRTRFIYNWPFRYVAVSREILRGDVHEARFYSRVARCAGYRSRAPPISLRPG